jgi:hypothetical protein
MHSNRFYDQDPVVSQAVKLLLLLPGEIQTLAAECLSKIAETEYRIIEMLQETKSLGSDKIMALYKSKHKKREYDQNPAMHRALNYLMLLTVENRRLLSHRVVGLISHLQDYLRSCQKFSILPTYQQMGDVATAFMQRGPEEATHLIQAMELQSFRHGRGRQRGEPLPATGEFITERNVGMRIRGTQEPNV